MKHKEPKNQDPRTKIHAFGSHRQVGWFLLFGSWNFLQKNQEPRAEDPIAVLSILMGRRLGSWNLALGTY